MEYEEFRKKSDNNDKTVDLSADLTSLKEKYEDALEIIQQLKNEQVSGYQAQSNEKSSDDQARLERLAEENLELREVVDHLASIFLTSSLL